MGVLSEIWPFHGERKTKCDESWEKKKKQSNEKIVNNTYCTS